MSYTFSRRDFMKYTVLAAAAVAVSGSLTGCSNSNQPTGKAGDTLSIIGKHTLYNDDTNPITYEDKTLVCHFHHVANSAISITKDRYEVRVIHEDGTIDYYNTKGDSATANQISIDKGTTLVKDEKLDVTLTVKNITITDTDTVLVRFNPRAAALENSSDSYSDCFATWDITKAVKALLDSTDDAGKD